MLGVNERSLNILIWITNYLKFKVVTDMFMYTSAEKHLFKYDVEQMLQSLEEEVSKYIYLTK